LSELNPAIFRTKNFPAGIFGMDVMITSGPVSPAALKRWMYVRNTDRELAVLVDCTSASWQTPTRLQTLMFFFNNLQTRQSRVRRE
jgi:hypothetical protein